MKQSTCRKSGFTLVELIVILVVLGVLGGIAIPKYIQNRTTKRRNACTANLKMMDGAKWSWSVETRQAGTAVPADSDIFGWSLYMGSKLLCPLGGTYSLNAISIRTTCSKSAAPDFHTI